MLEVYLTDLAAYNKGFLIGEWITLPCEDLEDKLKKILDQGSCLCFLEEGVLWKTWRVFYNWLWVEGSRTI